jgi:hypothetical protein
MNRRETFREYFRRARQDSSVRAHLLENARYSRSAVGWAVALFGILAFWQTGYQWLRHDILISRPSVFYTLCFVVNFLIYDKFGDRIAVLESIGDLQDPPPGPTAGPGESPAVPEPRLPPA